MFDDAMKNAVPGGNLATPIAVAVGARSTPMHRRSIASYSNVSRRVASLGQPALQGLPPITSQLARVSARHPFARGREGA